MTRILESLPQDCRLALEVFDEETDKCDLPDLCFSAGMGLWQENEGCLLTFKTPQLNVFCDADKKAIYILCLNVWHLKALESVRESKWQEFFAPGFSPKGTNKLQTDTEHTLTHKQGRGVLFVEKREQFFICF